MRYYYFIAHAFRRLILQLPESGACRMKFDTGRRDAVRYKYIKPTAGMPPTAYISRK